MSAPRRCNRRFRAAALLALSAVMLAASVALFAGATYAYFTSVTASRNNSIAVKAPVGVDPGAVDVPPEGAAVDDAAAREAVPVPEEPDSSADAGEPIPDVPPAPAEGVAGGAGEGADVAASGSDSVPEPAPAQAADGADAA